MSKEGIALPFGIKNLKDVRALDEYSKANEFPYNGLWLFAGAQGHGKTLTLMQILREIYKQYPEVLIVSNISIFGLPCIPYQGVEDFEKYENGQKGIVFVIDEIHTLFNSLESKNMPLSTVQVWCQNRKNRRVILGTSQRFNRVAKPIREQTKLLYQCYPPLFHIRRYRCFDASCFNDKGEYEGPAERMVYYIPSWDTMTGYNTLEVVKRSEYIKDGDK